MNNVSYHQTFFLNVSNNVFEDELIFQHIKPS